MKRCYSPTQASRILHVVRRTYGENVETVCGLEYYCPTVRTRLDDGEQVWYKEIAR